MLKLKQLKVVCLLALLPACGISHDTSKLDVTNGKDEGGFENVVKLSIDDRGMCTGTVISSSLVITAAHCVDIAKKITINGVTAEKSQFYMHPDWPRPGEELLKKRDARIDSALIQFPPDSFKMKEYPRLLKRTPDIGEDFTIVGFGNSKIEPYESFCKLESISNDKGECNVLKGTRISGAMYDYKSIFTYTPANGAKTVCSTDSMKIAIMNGGQDFASFVVEKCDGNFRDRSYKETGVGTKRSGSNKVLKNENGLIQFRGALGGESSGEYSASGAGDSGGPLFIKDAQGFKLAGTTHGGSLEEDNGGLVKKSMYVNLNSESVSNWLKQVTAEKNLDFPDFKQ